MYLRIKIKKIKMIYQFVCYWSKNQFSSVLFCQNNRRIVAFLQISLATDLSIHGSWSELQVGWKALKATSYSDCRDDSRCKAVSSETPSQQSITVWQNNSSFFTSDSTGEKDRPTGADINAFLALTSPDDSVVRTSTVSSINICGQLDGAVGSNLLNTTLKWPPAKQTRF